MILGTNHYFCNTFIFFSPHWGLITRHKSGAKTKPKKKENPEDRRKYLINDYSEQDHFLTTGGFGRGHKNNLQDLYKRRSIINQKLRRRKYKSRVRGNDLVTLKSPGLLRPRFANHIGLRVKRGFRIGYAAFIGMERTAMNSKGNFRIRFRKYPDLFVTKKSSKSRMGKGKGKIYGRAVKIRAGEVFLDYKIMHLTKLRRNAKALRQAVPSKTQPVFFSKWSERFFRRYYINKSTCYSRNWMFAKPKKRERKFWEKKVLIPPRWERKKLRYTAFAARALNFRRYFFKWFLTKKKQFFYDKSRIRIKLRRLQRQSFRAKTARYCKDWGYRPYRRFYQPRGFFLKTSLGKTGMCGSRFAAGKLKLMLSKSYTKRLFESYFAPDADGYTGLFKTANRIFKRKKRHDMFSTKRFVVSSDPFKY